MRHKKVVGKHGELGRKPGRREDGKTHEVDPCKSLSELGDLLGLEEGLGVDGSLFGNEMLALGLDRRSGNVLQNHRRG